MAWAAKRNKSAKTWTALWLDEDGRQRQEKGYADKRQTEILAQRREDECRQIRDGIGDPSQRARRVAAGRTLAQHLADYRSFLDALGGTPKHCRETVSAVARFLASGGVRSLADLNRERVLAAMKSWRDAKRVAKTINMALQATKHFATWLEESDRIASMPKGLAKIQPYSVESDRNFVRRHLTKEEIVRLFAAAESGPDRHGRTTKGVKVVSTGADRAAIYRLAMGTGFRANEVRTLTPERFHLDGDEPFIALNARDEKNRKGSFQPITRELAAQFRRFLEGKPKGKPVLYVPQNAARMLVRDMKLAGIPFKVARRGEFTEDVVDFHALRHSYITHLIRDGNNPKVVQALARHSDIRLTLGRYTHLESGDLRNAIEGRGENQK